jgi:bacterioferritin (cytochrome b1)
MPTTNNFSIHDDISARYLFFGINLALYVIRLQLTVTTEYIYVAQFGTAVFWLAALFCFPPTPFTKDIREFVLLDAIFYFGVSIIYALPNQWFNDSHNSLVFYQKTLNTLYLVRLAWPCRDEHGDYVGWPTFGLIGVFSKLIGRTADQPKLNTRQMSYGYLAIFFVCLTSYGLYRFNVNNLGVTGVFGLILITLFVIQKSVIAHKARIAAQTAQQASERAEAERITQLQMQNNLDAQLAADTHRNRAESNEEELAREKAEKAALIAKIAELEAMQTPESKRLIENFMALPEEVQQKQFRVIEALKGELEYFDTKE